jgi:hypothetical protein
VISGAESRFFRNCKGLISLTRSPALQLRKKFGFFQAMFSKWIWFLRVAATPARASSNAKEHDLGQHATKRAVPG